MIADALVHALVAAADEDQLLVPGQLFRLGLVETRTLRGKQDHARGRQRRARRFDGRDQRLGFHHHPGPAPVGDVVGHPVLAFREVADVHDARLEQALLARLAEDALRERSFDHAGKKREDGDAQLHAVRSKSPSGTSMVIFRAASSTSRTSESGTSHSFPSFRTRSNSCRPAVSRATTSPRSVPAWSTADIPIKSAAYS